MSSDTGIDWLAVCRRAGDGVRAELERFPERADRAVPTGRGEGGDIALVIDRAAEDVIFSELDALGLPLNVISEERGEVALHGGGETHVLVDPIDGSRNAKRATPSFGVSIAIADGPNVGDISFGYVYDLALGEQWHAIRGQGAYLNGRRLPQPSSDTRLELLALEMTRAERVARSGDAIAAAGAERLRSLGSVAISLCWTAAGRYDGFVTLAPTRSIDFAAAQLVVTEAGAALAMPELEPDPPSRRLELVMGTRVLAAANPALLERLLPIGAP